MCYMQTSSKAGKSQYDKGMKTNFCMTVDMTVFS